MQFHKIILASTINRMVTISNTSSITRPDPVCGGSWKYARKAGSMKIGMMIRGYRLQKGMSQGDIEKRTGLLRCYLSRVENGHTVPSLDTLAKIAQALDIPLAQFFSETSAPQEIDTHRLNDEELRFLNQIRRYSMNLNDSDRKLLLAMVKKFAATATR